MTLDVILFLLVILAGATVFVPLAVSSGVSAKRKYVLRSVALFAALGAIVGFIFSYLTEDLFWPIIWLFLVLPISMIGGAIFGAVVGKMNYDGNRKRTRPPPSKNKSDTSGLNTPPFGF